MATLLTGAFQIRSQGTTIHSLRFFPRACVLVCPCMRVFVQPAGTVWKEKESAKTPLRTDAAADDRRLVRVHARLRAHAHTHTRKQGQSSCSQSQSNVDIVLPSSNVRTAQPHTDSSRLLNRSGSSAQQHAHTLTHRRRPPSAIIIQRSRV